MTSVFVAIMEGDKRARQAAGAVRNAVSSLPMEGMFQAIGDLASTRAPQLALVKQSFGLVIKVIEQALLNNRDDIQYTNVFTFKESNDYLRGSLRSGNHKVTVNTSTETA